MPTEVEQQLVRFAASLDREASAVSVEEILGRRAVVVAIDPVERPSFDRAPHVNGMSRTDALDVHDEPVEPVVRLDRTPEVTARLPTRRHGTLRVALVAAVVAALVTALAVIALVRNKTHPVDVPTPTVPITAMSGLEVIEAGVAAFYSGNADRAAELFELADRTDDQIRAESAYQKAIGGRVSLGCTPDEAPGSFKCLTPYRNAMTDAIGADGGQDVWPVVVKDGVITQFGFTEHTGLLIEMATFLSSRGRFDGFEGCVEGPFDPSCATIEMENLDAWATWQETAQPADMVKTAVIAWYAGNCEEAVVLSWAATDCTASSLTAQATAYESILGAQVSLENCETTPGGAPHLSCAVHYSNAMNGAVGKPAFVTNREFILMYGVATAGPDENPWYEADYPEDTELRDSFRRFAESGSLAADYAAAECASTRSPACANLIIDNLDAWATWHKTNG